MRRFLVLPFLAIFASAFFSCEYLEEVEPRGFIASVDSLLGDTVIIHDTVTNDTCINGCCKDPYRNARVVLWQGHSIGDGRGEVISVVPDSTLWLASPSGLAVEMVTTQTTSNDGDFGSTARNFSIKHKEYFGGSIVLVNSCSGGADVMSVTDKNDWSTTGNLWAKSILKARNTLATVKKDSLYAIVIEIGINDAGANKPYASIKAAYQDLINRDLAEFPGTTILICQQAKTGSTGNATVTYDLRRLIIELARENENVHIAMSDAIFVGPSWMPDGTHPNAAAHDVKGAGLAQWFKNHSLGYSKWANSVLSTQFEEFTPARKNLVASFVDSQVSNGNYWKFERLCFFKTSTKENIYVDWSLMGYVTQNKIVYNANQDIQNNTAGGYWLSWVNPSVYTSRSGYTNFITGAKITARATAITAVGHLLGGGDANSRVSLQQNGSGFTYYANDLTASTASLTDIGFIPGNLYAVYRTGDEKGILKNTNVYASQVVPATVAANETIALSTMRLSGTFTQALLGNYEYYFYAAHDGFDMTSFYNAAETLTAAW